MADALWTTGLLIDHLLTGGAETNSASSLLSRARSSGCPTTSRSRCCTGSWTAAERPPAPTRWRGHADFAFPQQLNPDIAPAGWRPRFIDYLYLGFTNATAFSPTDTMPLAPWAKLAMTVQSLISLAILGLVVARAVNVFS